MTENAGTTRILGERVKVLGERVDAVEGEAKERAKELNTILVERAKELNTILVELRVLQARVGLFAGLIGGIAGLAGAVIVRVVA